MNNQQKKIAEIINWNLCGLDPELRKIKEQIAKDLADLYEAESHNVFGDRTKFNKPLFLKTAGVEE